jgi:hypothetical protein
MLSSAVALGAATMLPYAAPFAAKANKVLSSDWEQVRTRRCCPERACILLLLTGCRASSSTLPEVGRGWLLLLHLRMYIDTSPNIKT